MEHHFYWPNPPLRTIEVGSGLAVLVYAEPLAPAELGFRHTCASWPDEREADGTFTKVVAPRLTNHTVTGPEDALTIRPSILCPNCGLHGHVTDGRWVPC